MRKAIPISIILLIATLSLSSCYYDKADMVYPTTGTACDTSAVKFTANVVPILNSICYTCHTGTASLGGGIGLDSYAKVMIQVNNGKLLNAIQHTGTASPMPKGGGMMSACSIAIIRTWIRNGAPNN